MRHRFLLAVSLGLTAVILAVLAFLTSWRPDAAAAAPVIRYVATSADGGRDTGDCSAAIAPCATPQYAHDRAVDGDEIRVAAGLYTRTVVYGGVHTVLSVSKA